MIDRFVGNEKGWILIDSILGIVILAVAIMAISTGYQQALATTSAAHERNNAIYLAQQVLEELRVNDGLKAFNSSVVSVVTPTRIDGIDYNLSIDTSSNGYSDIQNQIESGKLLIQPVHVMVTWVESKSKQQRSVDLTTYYYLSPN